MSNDRTTMSTLSTVLLWLLVINLGVALGAGLYESRIVLPGWIDTSGDSAVWRAEAARNDDTGRRFWVAVTTVPLTLLTLANLFAGWRAPLGLRRWWLGTAATALVERALTLGYFVPTMIGLMQAENSPDAAATAVRWTQLNNLRHLLVAAALLAALKTFSLLYAQRGRAVSPSVT
jgi:hypothetical protein